MDDLTDEAQTDGLTGLPNRRSWDDRLTRIASDSKQFAVAVLDLDHFKEFNDTYGHPAGDFLARIGGEEFGLLLPDCDINTAAEVTDRLRRNVTQRRTCSAGLTAHQPGETAESAIARADKALYQAKSEGRNLVHVSAPPSSATSS
jgi:GGDEF domain-containing protein